MLRLLQPCQGLWCQQITFFWRASTFSLTIGRVGGALPRAFRLLAGQSLSPHFASTKLVDWLKRSSAVSHKVDVLKFCIAPTRSPGLKPLLTDHSSRLYCYTQTLQAGGQYMAPS
ncbi:TPA: hypothetical protein ACH3X1_003936 [Trebouxia sp. C0004]